MCATFFHILFYTVLGATGEQLIRTRLSCPSPSQEYKTFFWGQLHACNQSVSSVRQAHHSGHLQKASQMRSEMQLQKSQFLIFWTLVLVCCSLCFKCHVGICLLSDGIFKMIINFCHVTQPFTTWCGSSILDQIQEAAEMFFLHQMGSHQFNLKPF